nr:Protein T22B11.4, isoform a [Haemonchus contortus]
MRSWWIALTLYVTIALPSYISAFAVRQNDLHRECVDLQCPEAAFDSGVKSLVDEDSLSTEQCLDCNQCSSSGYSVCMRVRPNRGDRLVEGRTACSCAHTVPVNCHDRLHETKHPANISMKTYSICYMSALQAPPRPLAVNEGKSVIFTIEPFWLEPYWRELLLDNLTFHYDFNVKAPEHCEGTVTTSDDGQHLCTNSIALNITVGGVTGDDEHDDEEYEHSENYDQYDDDLPEEVEIDRDIFAGASEVQVYYLVDVSRPRQLEVKGGSITIHDAKTSVESEILKYDLTAGYQPTEDLPAVTETQDEGEDTSEEQGGIDNFENHRPSKSKEREPTKGEMHNKNVKTDVKSSEAKTTTDEPQVEHEDKSVEEHGDDDDELTTTVMTPKTTGEHVYVKTEGDDDEEVEEDEKKKEDDITEADGIHKTEEITESTAKAGDDSVEADAKHEEKMEKEGDNEEEEESSEQHDEDDDTETDEDEKEKENDEDLPFTERIIKDKGMLARWVFGATIALCLVFIICVCTFRRRCCRQKESSKTLAGHRYSSVNAQPLVIPPEKEGLNQ